MRSNITYIVLFLCQFGFAQTSPDLSGVWSTKTFPKFVYRFDSVNHVRFDWRNDLGSFFRKGTYRTKGDTILINFEPLIETESLNDSQNNNLVIVFTDKDLQRLPYFKIRVVTTNKEFIDFDADDNGVICIPDKQIIDDIKLDQEYLRISKGDTKLDNLESDFSNDFYSVTRQQILGDSIRLIVDYELMKYGVDSNTKELLIIDDNRLYNGINYDPKTIYVGGILTKE